MLASHSLHAAAAAAGFVQSTLPATSFVFGAKSEYVAGVSADAPLEPDSTFARLIHCWSAVVRHLSAAAAAELDANTCVDTCMACKASGSSGEVVTTEGGGVRFELDGTPGQALKRRSVCCTRHGTWPAWPGTDLGSICALPSRVALCGRHRRSWPLSSSPP